MAIITTDASFMEFQYNAPLRHSAIFERFFLKNKSMEFNFGTQIISMENVLFHTEINGILYDDLSVME